VTGCARQIQAWLTAKCQQTTEDFSGIYRDWRVSVAVSSVANSAGRLARRPETLQTLRPEVARGTAGPGRRSRDAAGIQAGHRRRRSSDQGHETSPCSCPTSARRSASPPSNPRPPDPAWRDIACPPPPASPAAAPGASSQPPLLMASHRPGHMRRRGKRRPASRRLVTSAALLCACGSDRQLSRKETNIPVAATLQQILLAPDSQPKVIDDCYLLIEQQVAELFRGLRDRGQARLQRW
jgi:hypothetical protein